MPYALYISSILRYTWVDNIMSECYSYFSLKRKPYKNGISWRV